MFLKSVSLCFLMVLPMAHAQQAKPAAESEPATLPLTTTLAKSYPVITVASACPKAAPKPGGCKTVITREEFEELVDAINPRMIKLERQSTGGELRPAVGARKRRGAERP